MAKRRKTRCDKGVKRKGRTRRQRVYSSYHGKRGSAFIREYDRRLRVMR